MSTLTKKDRETLHALASRVREIAELPEMQTRRLRWYRHNALQPGRPMVLAFPEGAWRELPPESECVCDDPQLRAWELGLRCRIYWWEHIRDDAAMEPYFTIGPKVSISGYGVDIPQMKSEDRGSYVWESPIKDIARDLPKLHFRQMTPEPEQTERTRALAEELVGDVLPVRLRSGYWWTVGMTWEVAKLIGLENLMLYMYDDPEGLHRAMAWMRDEHLNYISWFEKQGMLGLNNEDDYVGSGGQGYTFELPQIDWRPGQPARLIDRWGFAESQETVGVSPQMFAEFILPYQVPLLEKFGLNCYGCCEGLEHRIDHVLRHVPRLRRVSVSPFANQEVMAAKLEGKYIYSRKPNPSMICAMFDEDVIRKDVRTTLALAGDQPLEIIMKDTHTVQDQPERIGRWVEIAREEVDRFMEGRRPAIPALGAAAAAG